MKKINRRPIDLNQARDVIHQCENAGIRTSCFFIIGLPGSTRKTIEETIDYSKTVFASQTEYKVATPFPGTDLYKMAKENNWIKKEGFDALGGYSATMEISDELPIEYLEDVAEHSVVNYYFSLRYLWRYLLRGDWWTTAGMLVKGALRSR